MSLLDLGAQEPQQEQPQGLAGILGATPAAPEQQLSPEALAAMTPAQRSLFYDQSGMTASMAKIFEDNIEKTYEENEALSNSLELKGIFNEMGIDPFGENVEVSSLADTAAASGPWNARIYGSTTNEPSFLQDLATGFAGEGGSRAITARRRLVAKDYEKAYDSLRGGGQITEYEGKTVASALSSLAQASPSDELFLEQATNLYKKLDKFTKLAENNIQVNPQTGAEFIRDRDTGETRRVITFYNKNNGELDVRPLGSTDDIIELPDYLDSEQKTMFKAAIPIGQKFSFVDNNGNTVVLTKSREFNLPEVSDSGE